MTFQSPRVYIYKITFEEVQYYYYGVHKEKKFDEEYWGSPYTNKWCWELYTPKKQILEIFNYNDQGWINAQEIEKRIIRPVYNTDKWCLNESCGGKTSLKVLRENGRKTGKIMGKINGKLTYDKKTGVHGRSKEKMIEDARNAGKRTYELGVGIFSKSNEKMIEDGIKGGKIGGKKGGKSVSLQRWQCTITGYISTPAGLSHYQRAKGIEALNRIRIK